MHIEPSTRPAKIQRQRTAQDWRPSVEKPPCISARDVRPQARALLAYHSARDLRVRDSASCSWLLVQTSRLATPPVQGARWVLKQHTQRLGDREDQFWLYAHAS